MVHFLQTEGIEGRVFLVTGGAGFVGSSICLELLNRGASEVRCLDINTTRNLASLKSKGVKCITGDVRRKDDINKAIKGSHCVFHVASHGMLGKQSLQARRIDEVNLDGTCNVLEACVKYGVDRFVYTSTNNVIFGGQPIVNGNEAMTYFPLEHHVDPYGRSKALAEQLVLKNNNRPLSTKDGRKLYTCAIRCPIVYGPGEERHLSRLVNSAQLGLLMFKIGQSNVKTDFIYIDNLVNAHLLASMGLLDDVPGTKGIPVAAGKAYFVSDDAPTNYFDFARRIVTGLNYGFPTTQLSFRTALGFSWFTWVVYGLLYPWLEKSWLPEPLILPSEVYKVGMTHYFSSLRARQELGYVPLIDQKEGLERTLEYLKDKKNRELRIPTIGWWISILLGMSLLFCSAFVPSPFMGPLECIRTLGIFLHGSVANLRIVFVLANLAHAVEGFYAWKLAKSVDPQNAKAWMLQTMCLGFPSLRLLLKRAKWHKEHQT